MRRNGPSDCAEVVLDPDAGDHNSAKTARKVGRCLRAMWGMLPLPLRGKKSVAADNAQTVAGQLQKIHRRLVIGGLRTRDGLTGG